MNRTTRKFLDRILLALWLPLAWVGLLGTDLFLFAGERPQGSVPRLFEDIVFLLSFFFFRRTNAVHGTWSGMFAPFCLQFFFWWALCYLAIFSIARWKAKRVSTPAKNSSDI